MAFRKWTGEDALQYSDLQQQRDARQAEIAKLDNAKSAALAAHMAKFRSENPDWDGQIMAHAVAISEINAKMASMRPME